MAPIRPHRILRLLVIPWFECLVILKEFISGPVSCKRFCCPNCLGQASYALSQYPQAIEYYEQALTIAREVQNRAEEVALLNNLGAAYEALRQFPRAIEYLTQALTIAREVQDRGNEGLALSSLGVTHSALGRYPSIRTGGVLVVAAGSPHDYRNTPTAALIGDF